MIDFSEVIEKLKDIVSQSRVGARIYDKDVAAELGISQATFATMKKRNSIPYREILEFCAKRKISINWLFFDQPAEMLLEETGKFFRIKYFAQLRASAGGGAEVFDENFKYISVDRDILVEIVGSVEEKNIEAIRVEGESMEPTLKSGSIVFVDRSRTDTSKDGIYVVSSTGGLFVKRLRVRADGFVELISDNTLYENEIVSPEEISIVGKVVGSMESI
jgi:SOS-response transcriptional repressor LexA